MPLRLPHHRMTAFGPWKPIRYSSALLAFLGHINRVNDGASNAGIPCCFFSGQISGTGFSGPTRSCRWLRGRKPRRQGTRRQVRAIRETIPTAQAGGPVCRETGALRFWQKDFRTLPKEPTKAGEGFDLALKGKQPGVEDPGYGELGSSFYCALVPPRDRRSVRVVCRTRSLVISDCC